MDDTEIDNRKKQENYFEKKIKEWEAKREKTNDKWLYDTYTDLINNAKKLNNGY